MRLVTLLGLIVCNLIWSAHPMVSKWALEVYSPAHVAWFRFFTAFLSFWILIWLTRTPIVLRRQTSSQDWLLALGLGMAAFAVGPLLQTWGLSSSQAIDNALIVAMEPLITVLLAWIFLKERVPSGMVPAFGLALVGFGLLTGLHSVHLDSLGGPHTLGNLILLCSLLGEASYSVFSKKLLVRNAPLKIYAMAITLGCGVLTVAMLLISGVPDLSAMTLRSAMGILWLGPLGTTVCYLFWVKALTEASVASLAITIFIQPVFGALWGILFLGESLNRIQWIGALLILVGVFGQSLLQIQPKIDAPRE